MFTGVTKSTELLTQLALPGPNSQILKTSKLQRGIYGTREKGVDT